MAESVLLEDSTIYTQPAAAAATTSDSMAHANGYKPVLDKDLPSLDFMTATEWDTMFAIADALIPAVVPASKVFDEMRQLGIPDKEYYAAVDNTLASLHKPPPQQKLMEWLAFRAVEEDAFRREFHHSIAAGGPALHKQLADFMSLLESVTSSQINRFNVCVSH